jgi:hypothetical protein
MITNFDVFDSFVRGIREKNVINCNSDIIIRSEDNIDYGIAKISIDFSTDGKSQLIINIKKKE